MKRELEERRKAVYQVPEIYDHHRDGLSGCTGCMFQYDASGQCNSVKEMCREDRTIFVRANDEDYENYVARAVRIRLGLTDVYLTNSEEYEE